MCFTNSASLIFSDVAGHRDSALGGHQVLVDRRHRFCLHAHRPAAAAHTPTPAHYSTTLATLTSPTSTVYQLTSTPAASGHTPTTVATPPTAHTPPTTHPTPYTSTATPTPAHDTQAGVEPQVSGRGGRGQQHGGGLLPPHAVPCVRRDPARHRSVPGPLPGHQLAGQERVRRPGGARS